MKNARLLFALVIIGSAAACSSEATGPLPETPRNSVLMGGGAGTPPDSTTTAAANPVQTGG